MNTKPVKSLMHRANRKASKTATCPQQKPTLCNLPASCRIICPKLAASVKLAPAPPIIRLIVSEVEL